MLEQPYGAVSALLDAIGPDDLDRPTWCEAWAVRDVLVHLLGDAERALVACATPHPGPATVDAAGYFAAWAGSADRAGDDRAARFTRTVASAYRLPGLRAHWADLSGAAVRAVAARPATSFVATQGHVLTVGELERTLVLEASVHHLDVLRDLPHPPPELVVAAEVLSALAGEPVPPAPDRVLLATGRTASAAADGVRRGPGPPAFRVVL